jgi:hypothetical protein
MPLPAMMTAKRCHAKAKSTGQRCNNPAAYGMPVCRLHGARKKSTVCTGADHWNYRHGQETLEAKANNRETNEILTRIKKLLKL